MNIKITKTQLSRVAESIQYQIFGMIRNYSESISMQWLCAMTDIYRDILKKSEKFEQDTVGKINVSIPDNQVSLMSMQIEKMLAAEVKDTSWDDIEWLTEMADIYKQLKSETSDTDSHQAEVNMVNREFLRDESENEAEQEDPEQEDSEEEIIEEEEISL